MLRKSVNKNLILLIISVLLTGIALINKAPELPSSKVFEYVDEAGAIRSYIIDNIFAFGFSIGAFFVCIVVFGFICVMRKKTGNKEDYSILWDLGLFTLCCGVWVFTDSRALWAFCSEYGGALNSSSVALVSYLSIMLMPVFFSDFIKKIINYGFLDIMELLFVGNIVIFTVAILLRLPMYIYLFFLGIHHVLIITLIVGTVVYFVRNDRSKMSKQGRWLFHGTIMFMLFSVMALLSFLSGSSDFYAILFGTGFIIMGIYMLRIVLDAISDSRSLEIKSQLYEQMAYIDFMCDTANRNAFDRDYYGSDAVVGMCCAVIDINNLKKINDVYGHGAGDRLIKESARLIKEVFGDIGKCYRIGGDEFAVVIDKIDEVSI